MPSPVTQVHLDLVGDRVEHLPPATERSAEAPENAALIRRELLLGALDGRPAADRRRGLRAKAATVTKPPPLGLSVAAGNAAAAGLVEASPAAGYGEVTDATLGTWRQALRGARGRADRRRIGQVGRRRTVRVSRSPLMSLSWMRS